jgi:hypothetical protein
MILHESTEYGELHFPVYSDLLNIILTIQY